jgi:hypothetical protein
MTAEILDWNLRIFQTKTYSRRSTKIQQDSTLLQKSVFLVQLDQFERSSGSVSLLLGQLIPFIKATFSMLLLDTHDGELG